MQPLGKIDVHGLSIRGTDEDGSLDQFAIADLNKSMKLHQTNLSIDDETRIHGQTQGSVFLIAGDVGGAEQRRVVGSPVDGVVRYFLNEMPWYHLADGAPREVQEALEEAVGVPGRGSPATPGATSRAATLALTFVSWPDLYVAHLGSGACFLQRGDEVLELTNERDTGAARTPRVIHRSLEVGDVLALVTEVVAGGCTPAFLGAVLGSEHSSEEMCGELVAGPSGDDRTAVVARFLPFESALARSAGHPSGPLVARCEPERATGRGEPETSGSPRRPLEESEGAEVAPPPRPRPGRARAPRGIWLRGSGFGRRLRRRFGA